MDCGDTVLQGFCATVTDCWLRPVCYVSLLLLLGIQPIFLNYNSQFKQKKASHCLSLPERQHQSCMTGWPASLNIVHSILTKYRWLLKNWTGSTLPVAPLVVWSSISWEVFFLWICINWFIRVTFLQSFWHKVVPPHGLLYGLALWKKNLENWCRCLINQIY